MTGLFGRGLRDVPDSTFWATRGKRVNVEREVWKKGNKDDLRNVQGFGATPSKFTKHLSTFINT